MAYKQPRVNVSRQDIVAAAECLRRSDGSAAEREAYLLVAYWLERKAKRRAGVKKEDAARAEKVEAVEIATAEIECRYEEHVEQIMKAHEAQLASARKHRQSLMPVPPSPACRLLGHSSALGTQ